VDVVRPSQKCLLVVVDDDASVRTVLREVWEDEVGLDVRTAANGAEAQTILAGLPAAPCVIILDLNMPHVDGREVIEWLRGPSSRFAAVPILVISADKAGVEEVERVYGLPAFRKPFDLDRLVIAAREYCVPDEVD
jgi:CheY-like chemotaxis protein